jgi:hypothetical protein
LLGSSLLAYKGQPWLLKALADRYFYVPITLLVWWLCVAWHPRKLLMTPALLLVLWSFWKTHERKPMPDLHWKEASRCLDAHAGPCEVPIPPDWTIRTP